MGGAQAIAAFAFGTQTVPRADRIVGPGNIYVAAAKKLLAGEVGIDFIAGPTEILIIAGEGEPAWIAADMLAQAEHDVDASAILLTTSKRLAQAVAKEIEKQLATLPTAEVARKAIDKNSAIILVKSAGRSRRDSATASRPSISAFPMRALLAGHPARRQRLHRAAQPRSGGRLRLRPESRAADLRRRAAARRAVGGGLREGDLDAGSSAAERSATTRSRDHNAGARRRPGSPRPIVEVRSRGNEWLSGSGRARPSCRWRPTLRRPADAPTNCASTSTRTPSAARRKSSSF